MTEQRYGVNIMCNQCFLAASGKPFNETLLQHRHTTYNTKASLLQKTKKQKQKQILLDTILLLAPLLMRKLTLHIITYTTNCKTTHTHNTRTHSWARNRVL